MDLEDRIVSLRKELLDYGTDAGAATIETHLSRVMDKAPSISTIHRVLVRRGFVTPQPKKRPKSSFIRFEADQPNEMWQSDFTEYELTTGRTVQILNFIDDHSRLMLASRALPVVKGADVIATFVEACEQWGTPACVLTDNGAVYNAIGCKAALPLRRVCWTTASASPTNTHGPTIRRFQRVRATSRWSWQDSIQPEKETTWESLT